MKKRLQFDFTAGMVEVIDTLQADMGAVSRAEVVRRSVMIAREILRAEKSGAKILIVEPDEMPTRIMFTLPASVA